MHVEDENMLAVCEDRNRRATVTGRDCMVVGRGVRRAFHLRIHRYSAKTALLNQYSAQAEANGTEINAMRNSFTFLSLLKNLAFDESYTFRNLNLSTDTTLCIICGVYNALKNTNTSSAGSCFPLNFNDRGGPHRNVPECDC